MASYLKSTAYTRMFKLIASSDHISLKTGVTATVNISKAGAAFGAAAGTVTEVGSGWYKIALTTADTNTAGDLAFYITGTAADDTDFVDQVLDPAAANSGVNVVNWNGSAVVAPNVAGVPIIDLEYWDGVAIAEPATDGVPDVNVKNINNVSASAVTTVKAVQGLTTADTIATYTGNTPQTGDAFLRLGAPAGASIAADLAEIEGETDAIGTGVTVSGYAAGQDTAVRRGTAQAGGASTITLDSGASATDHLYEGLTVALLSATGVGQARIITGYVGSTKVATVTPAWTTAPDATSVFALLQGQVDVEAWKGAAAPANTGDAFARLGAPAGASVSADIAEVEGETDTILANTTGITFTVANQVDVNVVDWKGAAAPAMTGDAFARLGAPAGASIAADLAEIEAETDGIAAIPTSNGTNQTGDTYALLTGANTELAAVPASTATLVDMLRWLFILSRNKLTQTATTQLVRNNADGATVGTATVSDDGTVATRGKFA